MTTTVANPGAANEALDSMREQRREQRAKQRENLSIKAQLQQDRAEHTFEVEWYERDLPFNPLPKDASEALDGKRERMAHCADSGNWQELAEQADELVEMAPEWLEAAWDGDEPMFASDWEDVYDSDELLKLLNKVDQKGDGAEMEAVVEFLG